jgi:hypothetical protein
MKGGALMSLIAAIALVKHHFHSHPAILQESLISAPAVWRLHCIPSCKAVLPRLSDGCFQLKDYYRILDV